MNTLMKSQTDLMNTANNLNPMEKSGSINIIQGQGGEADVVLEGEQKEMTEESEDIPPEKIPDKNTGFQIYKSVFSHHRNYDIVLNDKVNHRLGLSPL